MLEALLAVASIALPALRSDVRHKQELRQAQRLHQAEAQHTRELLNEKMVHRAGLYSQDSTLAVRRHNISMEVARSMSRREALRDAWQQRSWFLQTMILIVSLVFSLIFVALTQGRVIDIAQVQYTIAVDKISLEELVENVGLFSSFLQDGENTKNNDVLLRLPFNSRPVSHIFGVYLWMSSTGVSIGSLVICLWLCMLIQRRVGRYRVLPSLADAGSASTSTTVSTNPFQTATSRPRASYYESKAKGHDNNKNEKETGDENGGADDEDQNSENNKNEGEDTENHGTNIVATASEHFSRNYFAATGGAVDGQNSEDDDDDDEEDQSDGNNNNNNSQYDPDIDVGDGHEKALIHRTQTLLPDSHATSTVLPIIRVGDVDDDEEEDEEFEEEEVEEEEEEEEDEQENILSTKKRRRPRQREDEEVIDDEIRSVVDFIMSGTTKAPDHLHQKKGHNLNTNRSNNNNNNLQLLSPNALLKTRSSSFADGDGDISDQYLLSPHRRASMIRVQEQQDGIVKDRSPDFVVSHRKNNKNTVTSSSTNSNFCSQQQHRYRGPTALINNDDENNNNNIGNEMNEPIEMNEKVVRDDDDDLESFTPTGTNRSDNLDIDDNDKISNNDVDDDYDVELQQDFNNASGGGPAIINNNNLTSVEHAGPPQQLNNNNNNNNEKEPNQSNEKNDTTTSKNKANTKKKHNSNKNDFYYNCGKTHRSFNSYYDCHCEPLRRLAALLLGLGTFCAMLSGASLHVMLMRDVFFGHHDSSAYFPIALLVFVAFCTFVWSKVGTDSDRLLSKSMNHGEGDFMGLSQEAREQTIR